jgi:hypothetical protein
MSDMHATGQAKTQLEAVLVKQQTFYKSAIPVLSRKYKSLSIAEQHAVLNALLGCGSIEEIEGSKSKIKSNLYIPTDINP